MGKNAVAEAAAFFFVLEIRGQAVATPGIDFRRSLRHLVTFVLVNDPRRDERLPQLGVLSLRHGDDPVFVTVDLHLVEPCLVEVAPGAVSGSLVGLSDAAQDGGHMPEDLVCLLVNVLEPAKLDLDLRQLATQLPLLVPGDVARDSALHGLLGPLVALTLDLILTELQPGALVFGVGF